MKKHTAVNCYLPLLFKNKVKTHNEVFLMPLSFYIKLNEGK